MTWIFLLLGLVIVVVIGLVVLGRETARLADVARPAVFDMTEAIDFIADRLPEDTQARISHDDVHWILMADADLLEEATAEYGPAPSPGARAVDDRDRDGGDVGDDAGADAEEADVEVEVVEVEVVDEDAAIARILALADESGREIEDQDIVAVLACRLRYLEAIGAIGPEAE